MTDFDSCFAMRKGKLVLRGIANQTLPNDTKTLSDRRRLYQR